MKSQRLELQSLSKQHYNEMKSLYSDVRVRRFLGGTLNEKAFNEHFNKLVKTSKNNFHWALFHQETKKFIGFLALNNHHDDKTLFEVSYQIHPDHWRNRFAEEAISFISEYAKEVLKQKQLIAETQSANQPSIKLLEKLEFKLKYQVMRHGETQSIYYRNL